jgi:hypothetical protein
MATSILFYYNILQLYFGVAIAVFIAAQPLLILITSASHAVEVWAKSRGWKRLNTCAYWTAKIFGTISAIDARNVQRAGGKVFDILAALLSALPNTKAVKSINKGAMTLVLIAGMASLPLAQGCAWFKGAVVAGQAACQSELANVPEVIAEAKVRGISVGQLIELFCDMSDVAAVFTSEAKPGTARKAALPRNQAVTLLRAKGERE